MNDNTNQLTDINAALTNADTISSNSVSGSVDKELPKTDKATVVLTGRAKGWANLKPAKKGEIRNPHGKTGPRIKDELKDILKRDKEKAKKIANTIIDGAIQGDNKKIEMALTLNDESIDVSPVQVNNLTVGDDFMEKVRQYVKDNSATKTIDVTTV